MDEQESPSIRNARQIVWPIVTLAFAGAVIWFTYLDKLSSDAFLGIATTVILFWFRDRKETPSEPSVKPGVSTGGK